MLHGCHLAKISWRICSVQELVEKNGNGELGGVRGREWGADQEAGV